LLAHEATAYAKEKGLDGAFHHVAARAYWESGVDLGDLAVLKGLTGECGLDWAELGPRLESGYYRQRVLEQYDDSRKRGVSGTPTYQVEGGEPTFGNLRVGDLRELIGGSKGSSPP
jgi:predicted DsbA family dithiol-disulfide isomerase